MHLNVLIICDTYYPENNSAALQLHDLACELANRSNRVSVLTPISANKLLENSLNYDAVNVLNIKTFNTKSNSYIKRTLSELLLPVFFYFGVRKYKLLDVKWDLIIWYSPTIFLGPFISYIKKKSGCKAFLILRDIFPKWALDLGLINCGAIYYFFKLFELYQYMIADHIYVQSKLDLTLINENLELLTKKLNALFFTDKFFRPTISILHNWLTLKEVSKTDIDLKNTILNNRVVFIYSGNFGPAQNVKFFLDAAFLLRTRTDIGFLFIGRGIEFNAIRDQIFLLKLNNCLIFNSISPNDIPSLLSQCHVGLVSLNINLSTGNIPGKFITYICYGLPVLAVINEKNDLVEIIRNSSTGMTISSYSPEALMLAIIQMANEISNLNKKNEIKVRCTNLWSSTFSTNSATDQLISDITSL
jgi:glycosyltransferase involved in cell wall biosynthesis